MMTTYYVHPKGISDSQLISPVRMPAGMPLAQTPNLQRQTSHHGSFSAVVFGMMQATKRSTAIPGTRKYLELVYREISNGRTTQQTKGCVFLIEVKGNNDI